MEPITVRVTEAHIAEFERRWNALDEGGDYDETKDRATALALQEALQKRRIQAQARVHVYDEEPTRIFIGDFFCLAPAAVSEYEWNGRRAPFDFTLFAGEEAWARHFPVDEVAATLRGTGPRIYSAYVTSDNALFDDFESGCLNAQAIADEGGTPSLDLLTLREIAREPQDVCIRARSRAPR